MNNYYELRISINPEIEDIVSDICFSNFDCEGVVLAEESYKDLEMTSTTRGTLRVFLTDLNNNPVEVLKTERELLKERGFTDEELGSWEITLDEKENQDWSKKWKEKWTVTHVSDKIAVVPSWINYEPKEGEITITLDPGCAFGTGTHQTTQLCMKAIEKYMQKGDTMADIGTGSGILAICAIKLGAKSAYGCDNDETVIDVCRKNAEINGIAAYPPLEGGSKSLISGWGKKEHLHKYPKLHITLAKNLRNNATDAEKLLWNYLRKSNLAGVKFRRQQPVGNYIVDFMAPQQKIIIELDGGEHNQDEKMKNDRIRDEFLIQAGYKVLRFWNCDIFNNIDGVLNYILHVINDPTPKSEISTLPQGEGKPRVYFELNTADKIHEQYDFVCANILHNILAEIMGDLKNIMKDGAKIVLSGILDEKKDIVLNALKKHNLKLIETMNQDQWAALIAEK